MRTGRRDDRGAAALEFALVLPILLVIVLGLINFGIVFAQNLALNNAARQAARYGAVNDDGRNCTTIASKAKTDAASLALKTSDVGVAISPSCSGTSKPCAGSASGTSVSVTLTYNSKFLVPFPVPGISNSINIEGKGEFRCEFS